MDKNSALGTPEETKILDEIKIWKQKNQRTGRNVD